MVATKLAPGVEVTVPGYIGQVFECWTWLCVRPLFGHFSRWRSESLGIQVRILEKMGPGFSQNQTGVPTKRKRRSMITVTRPKGRKIKSDTP